MKTRILIAISGGLDSMVLLHRLQSEHRIEDLAVAHCNFNLRGEESDEDERFVVKTCELYGLRCYVTSFRTEDIAHQRSLSIQETARNLRYDWFFELQQKEQFHHIATAHHMDDSVETFFINLLRGSGPKGLSGITEDLSRGVIRPLLGMTRKDIRTYAKKHSIEWREDSSNKSRKYLRNRIRQELIPLLEDIRPGYLKAIEQNMNIQSQLADLIKDLLPDYLNEHVEEYKGKFRISLDGGARERLLLHDFLSKFSFSSTQVENILDAQQSGKQIFSSTHTITRQGDKLLLNRTKNKIVGSWNIEKTLDTSMLPIDIELTMVETPPKELNSRPERQFLDFRLLKFPLILRNWRDGDRFIPFGMKGQKKVSDYLIDCKVTAEDKKRVFVIESDGEIACLIGFRISEGFKITQSTDEVLVLRHK